MIKLIFTILLAICTLVGYFSLIVCGGQVKFKFFFAWYDAWVDIYYDRKKTILYIIPFPMFVFSFSSIGNVWKNGGWR